MTTQTVTQDRERKIQSIDPNILLALKEVEKNLPRFKETLIAQRAYTISDPVDISIIPRLLKREETSNIESICRSLTETATSKLLQYLDDPSRIPKTPLNDYLSTIPKKQKFFSGNARYDFLNQGEDIKLIEMNFVNVGSSAYSPKVCLSLLEVFPALADFSFYKSPVDSIKARIFEQGVNTLLLLTKNEGGEVSLLDRILIQESLYPVNTMIVPERNYINISFDNENVFYNGIRVDAIYPRYLDDLDSIMRNQDLCRKLSASNVFIFDHFLMMLLEDKDLRFLIDDNPELESFIPYTTDVPNMDSTLDYSSYVLKLRNTHSGEGVIISPTSVNVENAILQERLYPNKFPVLTIEGKKGNAAYDTSVYISYCLDLEKRRLQKFEVSGYLTRFSLDNDITNMCQGGGMIPTLIEK